MLELILRVHEVIAASTGSSYTVYCTSNSTLALHNVHRDRHTMPHYNGIHSFSCARA